MPLGDRTENVLISRGSFFSRLLIRSRGTDREWLPGRERSTAAESTDESGLKESLADQAAQDQRDGDLHQVCRNVGDYAHP